MAQLFLIWPRRGDLFPSREPSLVTTIRGSCATVCLFHPVHRAAAKCHYLLPVGDHDSENRSYRYVDSILPRMMKTLIKKLIKLRIDIRGIVVVQHMPEGFTNHLQ